jgi:hypothetical protein
MCARALRLKIRSAKESVSTLSERPAMAARSLDKNSMQHFGCNSRCRLRESFNILAPERRFGM